MWLASTLLLAVYGAVAFVKSFSNRQTVDLKALTKTACIKKMHNSYSPRRTKSGSSRR
jgi:hypothetical protein